MTVFLAIIYAAFALWNGRIVHSPQGSTWLLATGPALLFGLFSIGLHGVGLIVVAACHASMLWWTVRTREVLMFHVLVLFVMTLSMVLTQYTQVAC